MVKIEEYVTVSVVNIRASQIASPKTHGYCRQSQYNSKGMAGEEEKMKANLTMSEIGNRTISQDCISLGLKNQVEISWGVFTCSILASIVTILVGIVVILEKCEIFEAI